METMRKVEGFLRVVSIGLLVATACLVGLNTQTKLIFGSFAKKATVKDLDIFVVLVVVEAVAAGYNLVQLWMSFVPAPSKGTPHVEWYCFFLDQVVTYISFAANAAAAQGSLLAVTGSNELQWLKLCNTYTRFCIQIGGSLLCGFSASLVMVVVSSISAFKLFRFYSSKNFLALKPTKN